MVELLVDTDVFVDHLRGRQRLSADRPLHYSVITRCELLSGRGTDGVRVQDLLAPFPELPVDRAIAERAGMLRRSISLRLPDSIIAATALCHGLRLLTRNRRDFAAVPRLEVEAP